MKPAYLMRIKSYLCGKRLIISLLSVLLAMSFHACTPPAYVTNTVHAPIFSNQGEFQVRLNGGTSGLDPQISYAATEHIGLMANGSFLRDNNDGIPDRAFGELGVGYYNNFDGRLVFEVFAGYGVGNVESVFTNSGAIEYTSNASMQRIFLQPAFGMVTDVFDISLAARFANLELDPETPSDLVTRTTFFEPAATVGIGFKYIKAHLQFGVSTPFENDSNLAYTYSPFLFNVGVAARIGRKYF